MLRHHQLLFVAALTSLMGWFACSGDAAFAAGSRARFDYHRGKECKRRFWQLSKRYLLGSDQEGIVWRVQPWSGAKTFVLKKFSSRFGFDHDNRTENISSLRALRKIAKGIEGMKVVKVLGRRGWRTLKLADVRGRTLREVLDKHLVSAEEEKQLLATYDAFAQQMKTWAKSRYDWLQVNDSSSYASAPAPVAITVQPGLRTLFRHLYLSLSPKNIIVDPTTLEMTIIDGI